MSESLIALIIAEIAQRIPALAIDLIRTLHKKDVTDADWDALQAKYGGKTYDKYIADARSK